MSAMVRLTMILNVALSGFAAAEAVQSARGTAVETAVVRDALGKVLAAIPGRLVQLGIPGTAIAVVYGGEVLVLAGYGTGNPETGTPVNVRRDVFRVGSVSKPVTASGILRLVARGAVSLDEDLRNRLDNLPVRPPLRKPITLRHLLTHTAGFNERLFGQHVSSPERMLSLSDYLSHHLPPRFIEPGEVIAYNDHHTALAGWLLEELTGRRFDEAMAEAVFEPLGMTSSTFAQRDIPSDIDSRIVSAWHQGSSGFRPYTRDYVQLTPAAGLYTSAPDMARYLIALLDCRNGPLGEAVCSQLIEQFSHHARLSGRSFGFARSDQAGMGVFYKDGQASGFNARLLLVPERGFGVFIVHNRSILGSFGAFDTAARFNRETTQAMLDRLWPESGDSPAEQPEPLADSAGRTSGYAGSYRTVIAARHTWERLASLFDEVQVTATSIGVRLAGREYVEIEPGVLQHREGEQRYLVFRTLEGERPHLFIGGGAYEPVP
ncbi:MAG: beta-lactamase family protein, partial [Pseudomonadales bacterium]|nr:beta-lactamase family protein [Pseudomonadales bacterium]